MSSRSQVLSAWSAVSIDGLADWGMLSARVCNDIGFNEERAMEIGQPRVRQPETWLFT